MPLALNLVVGPVGAAEIERLRDRLRAAGLPASDVPAHVTIAVVDQGDPAALVGAFSSSSSSSSSSGPPPSALRLVHLGVFLGPPAVAFAGVAPTPELVAVHERTWARVDRLGGGWPRYRPGWWVPHCTLAMPLDPDDAGPAITALSGTSLPIVVEVTGLAVSDLATGATLARPWPR